MKKIFLALLCIPVLLFSQDRKIQAGDALEIVVYGHQELSRTVQVSDRGTIDFPFMQSLPVDGLTTERLKEIIVAQLSRYLDTYPVVTVGFSKVSTMTVSVLGMVANPGVVQLSMDATVQGAIAAAGGFLPGAKTQQVSLMRPQDNGYDTQEVNLERFVLEGKLEDNPGVSGGDIVLVTGNPLLSTVKVIGEVNAPGAYESFMGATILDMLLLAGGPSEESNMDKVKYISPSRKKSFEFSIDLDRLMASNEYYNMPIVKPGDIIVVPAKKNIWRGALTLVRDISTVAIAVWYIARLYD
ncbi:hypothetical protein GF406_10370 [candidate division KSB1 bacterium]|nr:hypothetical protein [candidate division KSB1 bacterium]